MSGQRHFLEIPLDVNSIPISEVADVLAGAIHDRHSEDATELQFHAQEKMNFAAEIKDALRDGILQARHPSTCLPMRTVTRTCVVSVDDLAAYLAAKQCSVQITRVACDGAAAREAPAKPALPGAPFSRERSREDATHQKPFDPLSDAIEPHVEKSFAELPPDLRTRIADRGGWLAKWDDLRVGDRLILAQQSDEQTNPLFERENEYWFELEGQIQSAYREIRQVELMPPQNHLDASEQKRRLAALNERAANLKVLGSLPACSVTNWETLERIDDQRKAATRPEPAGGSISHLEDATASERAPATQPDAEAQLEPFRAVRKADTRQEPDNPAPVVEVSASEPIPVAPLAQFNMSRSGLIKAHKHEWPTIERDLQDASENGLSAAKAGRRDWNDAAALCWARAKGKLEGTATPAGELSSAFHRMSVLPSRKHTIKG